MNKLLSFQKDILWDEMAAMGAQPAFYPIQKFSVRARSQDGKHPRQFSKKADPFSETGPLCNTLNGNKHIHEKYN
jgi:hypothetical protein